MNIEPSKTCVDLSPSDTTVGALKNTRLMRPHIYRFWVSRVRRHSHRVRAREVCRERHFVPSTAVILAVKETGVDPEKKTSAFPIDGERMNVLEVSASLLAISLASGQRHRTKTLTRSEEHTSELQSQSNL